MSTSPKRIGAKKFVLIHHGGCFRNSFHYRIDQNGKTQQLISDNERTQHPNAIAIQLTGDFDIEPVSKKQFDALKQLVLELKLRYPTIQVGGHRQVRGDKATTCPGRKFPLTELRDWVSSNLVQQRDDYLQEVVESQYRP